MSRSRRRDASSRDVEARPGRRWAIIALYLLYLGILGYLTLGRQPLEQLPLGVDRVISWFVDVPAAEGAPGATPTTGAILAVAGGAPDGGVSAGRAAVIVGNVVLFLPVGIISRRELHRSLTAAFLAGLLVSGTIELLQLTVATWRNPQLIDLGLNTLGAGLGWWLAQAVAVLRQRRERS